MADEIYLNEIIERIEKELCVHDKKFSGSHVHEDCLPRFVTVLGFLKDTLKSQIANKQKQLVHMQTAADGLLSVKSPLPANGMTVRGDEFEPAESLFEQAHDLENEGCDQMAVQATRWQARESVARQLNEFDGFNR